MRNTPGFQKTEYNKQFLPSIKDKIEYKIKTVSSIPTSPKVRTLRASPINGAKSSKLSQL